MPHYLIFFLILCSSMQAQVAVIVHKSVKAENISKTQLLDFYTGEVKSWDTGEAVHVFDLKIKGKIKETFYKYLGKSASRMKSIWMKRLLSGEGDPPPALEDESEMLKRIKNTKGAIGFLDYKYVDTSVKVLTIIEFDKINDSEQDEK